MIFLKSDEEIELLRISNQIVAKTLAEMAKIITPGISTAQLDKIAEEYIRDNGAVPGFLGYGGFPGSICTSVNDQVVHGIPSDKVILEDGDIISVDCGVYYQGFHSDSAYTYPLEGVSAETLDLLNRTYDSLGLGIEVLKGFSRL